MKFLRALLATVLAVGPLLAAIDGTVINKTTGKPVAKAAVTLIKLGQGMEPVGSVDTDEQGNFRFAQEIAGPALLQTTFQEVNYNQILPPGMPRTGVTLAVYNATPSRASVRTTQHMILLEPAEGGVTVNETVLVQNDGDMTVVDPRQGALTFYAGGGKGEPQVNVTGPAGMPLPRPADKLGADTYILKYPLKHGETKIEVGYQAALKDGVYHGKILHGEGPVRIVVPNGVELSGPNIKFLDREPTTQASIYDVLGKAFDVTIKGAGRLTRAANAAAAPAEEDSNIPEIEVVRPRIYDKLYWVLGLVGAVLILTMIYQLRQTSPSR